MTLRARILEVLKEAGGALDTGAIVFLCAADLTNPQQQVGRQLTDLMDAGHVRKLPPVRSGKFRRPASRWELGEPKPERPAGLLTTAEAAVLVGRPYKTLSYWKFRGLVSSAATVSGKNYWNADAVKAAAERIDNDSNSFAIREAMQRKKKPSKKPPALAKHPTDSWPGTTERVAVYEARVKAGRAVFHPLDFKPK